MIGMLLVAFLPVAELVGTSAGDARETAPRFAYAGQPSNQVRYGPVAARIDHVQPRAVYRLSGEKSLRPVRIGDDGTHMYLEWSEEQALPAVFALNAIGEEEMVDGYMRSGIFTIDRVYPALVFRIGKKRALARRMSK